MVKNNSTQKWVPNFTKWYDVDVASYKFIFEQAEKRMEDVLSESESITDKSIKIITAIAAMFAFFVGFLIKKEISFGENYVPIFLFTLNIGCALFLLFPKKVRVRGIAPKILLPLRQLDNQEDKAYQEHILYYSAIVILQDNIDFMIKKNAIRSIVYLVSLLLGLVLLIVGTGRIITYL